MYKNSFIDKYDNAKKNGVIVSPKSRLNACVQKDTKRNWVLLNTLFLYRIKSIVNVNKVRIGIGSDTRIGYDFIYPGTGYGGSCFPKDVRALIKTSEENGIEPSILKSVEAINNEQKTVLVEKVIDIKNNSYFCNRSWTLSYSMNLRKWISFHSYIPNFYIEP